MVDVRFKHIANLKGAPGEKGDKGDPGTFTAATATTVPANVPAAVRMRGPQTARVVDFDIPRGLPGVNAVPSDEFIATVIGADDTDTRGALRKMVPTIVGIDQFVAEGETLDRSGNGLGDNTVIIQRAVNTLTAAYAIDRIPRQIYFPDGTYRLADSGNIPGSEKARYSIRWRSGVGIATSSRRGVVFVCPPTASAFVAASNEAWMNIEDVYCDPHVVDGRLQTNDVYTAQFKAWYIQGLRNARFEDVCVRNTFSTGFGCDYLRNVYVSGEADGCGRGIKELGIDPLSTSGGSGFGIGTGLYEVEDFTLDVTGRNCGFHGVFTETQGGRYLSKGGRIKAYVEGNFVGFRDCGCDGLQTEIVARNNRYAEVYHAETVLNQVTGRNGHMKVDLSDGQVGIMFGDTGTPSAYKFSGEIRGMALQGVMCAEIQGRPPERAEFDLTIHDCGSSAIVIDRSATKLTFKVREWNNSGRGLRLLNRSGSAVASDLTFLGCDFENGVEVAQAIAGDWKIAATRGLSETSTGGVRGSSSGTDEIVISWSPVITTKTVSYLVEYKRLYETDWVRKTTSGTSLTVTGLASGGIYEYRVAAVVDGTQGPWNAGTNTAQAGFSTVRDMFDRPDGNLDGSQAPDGSVYPTWQTYTTAEGAFGIRGMQAKAVSGGAVFALIPTTKTRGAIGVTVTQVNSDPALRRAGLVFGYKDANNYYRLDGHIGSTGNKLAIRKVKNGVTTALAVSTRDFAATALRVEFDAAVGRIAWFYNGVYVASVIDSDFTSVERVGLFGDASVDPITRYNDFVGWGVGA